MDIFDEVAHEIKQPVNGKAAKWVTMRQIVANFAEARLELLPV